MATFPVETWKADVVRVTLFGVRPWSEAPESIFSTLMGTEADSTSAKPSAGEASAIGGWDDYELEVKKTINRLDFLVKPRPATSPDIPLIAQPTTVKAQLSERVAKWASNQEQEICRVAVGCGGMWPVTDTAEGNKAVSELTGVFSSPMTEYRDLQVQLNKTTYSHTEPSILINRVVRCFSLKIEVGLFSGPAQFPMQNLFFTVFVTDVNSDADRKESIDTKLISPLIEELAKESNRLLAMGGP